MDATGRWGYLRLVHWPTWCVGLLAVVAALVLVAVPLAAWAQTACTDAMQGGQTYTQATGATINPSQPFCAQDLARLTGGWSHGYCMQSATGAVVGYADPAGAFWGERIYQFVPAGCTWGPVVPPDEPPTEGGPFDFLWRIPMSAEAAGQILAACAFVLAVAWGLRQARKALD